MCSLLVNSHVWTWGENSTADGAEPEGFMRCQCGQYTWQQYQKYRDDLTDNHTSPEDLAQRLSNQVGNNLQFPTTLNLIVGA